MPKDKLRSTILFYLFHSIKEIGISLPLLFRRITETASRDIDYLSKEFFEGKLLTHDLKQLISDLIKIVKNEELANEATVKYNENEVNIDIHNCKYLEVAKKAKKHGYSSCPICLMSLIASIASTVVKEYDFNTTEYNTDLNNGVCHLKITYTKE